MRIVMDSTSFYDQNDEMLDDEIQGEKASEPSLTGKKRKETERSSPDLPPNQGRKLLIEESAGKTLSNKKMILHNATVVSVV
ncbi:hypothetical protein F2Q69_00039320 [Brassica cretica]|uniref:Uncharacterized protein n=1 Tax=Brassica cretica TaxID=69181 RepID=A0A8S9SQ03_BRACR|nr:hypothetical protein F2Q69_00039320 [Brassica cretica]